MFIPRCVLRRYISNQRLRTQGYTIGALSPNTSYDNSQIAGETACDCNTVVWTLFSACARCQGGEYYKYGSLSGIMCRFLISFLQLGPLEFELYTDFYKQVRKFPVYLLLVYLLLKAIQKPSLA